MDLMQARKISASGLAAHRTKMNVIAENLANAQTTRTAEGGPYRRKMVVYASVPMEAGFKDALDRQAANKYPQAREMEMTFNGVEVIDIVKSQEDFSLIYNPGHPDADPQTGYVAMPNVDTLTEMADMVVARRAYDASISAIANVKSMSSKALEIGK